ncbi:MAG: PBP1A family penicillin-binding protein [Patescibacteria group bacterium]|nr:PBP1A family penicillin-binding protein [Patescibacteria group bacterium]
MPIPELKKPSPYLSENRPKRKKDWKAKAKSIAVILVAIGLTLSLVGALAFTIMMAWISRELPEPGTLLTREVAQSTKIYDRTGEILLYEVHGDENRTLVKLSEIPEYVPHATIAIEDKDFYGHHGVYWRGLVRAFTVGFIQNRRVEGTSTLTQQLVKNAILTNERTLTRKLKELLLSLQIERKFTKDQILELYLNEIPYGSTMYGIEAAAEGYFNKSAKELTLDEAALLAAMPQAPDLYNPYGTGSRGDNRELLIGRQHTILSAMAAQGYVTEQESEDAKAIDTLAKLQPRKLSDIKAPHFVMYVRDQLIEEFGQKEVEQGGLRVITSLDWDKQQIAEEEVKAGVEKNGERYGYENSALISLDPKNGQILAMVGSADFFNEDIDGQVNVTISPRQPGSSFKPIVYTAGFIKGYTSETILWDVFTVFNTEIGPYKPNNYNLRYAGPLTVRQSLQQSLNIPAVKMMYLVGTQRVIDFAEQLGYTTFADRSRFGMSLVLGGGEVKLIEHANAYAAMANEGVQYPITSILKTLDSNGDTLYEWQQADGQQAIPQDAALQITNVLSDNSVRTFAQSLLTLPGRPVAAKTGTTNNNKDAWTMGYTPNLVAGVWAGNSRGEEMERGADGAVIAAPVWHNYMKRATADMPVEQFKAPPQLTTNKPVLTGKSFKTTLKIDTVSGKIATEYTPPEFIEEKDFYEGHNILWYVDKNDPQGPAPTNPQSDPQFKAWESAVQAWIEKEQWNTTTTAPTEYDDVHTAENKPSISISSPQNNANIYSRNFEINVSAQSQRNIARIEAKTGETIIGETTGSGTINARIPNNIPRGYHEIIVKITDDVGNSNEARITINLNADLAPINVSITSPAERTRISGVSFPIPVFIQINEISDISRIDLKYEQKGSTKLIGSILSPDSYNNQINWVSMPEIGQVTLIPYAVRKDGSTIEGDKIKLTIDP